MDVDRPDEEEAALDKRGAVPDSRGTAPADSVVMHDHVAAETRDPAAYCADLRLAVAVERWEATVAVFTERWADHERRWPCPDTSAPRGANRALDSAASTEVDRACDRVRDIERRVITPAMLEIQAEDSGRELVGFDHRLKGEDRLKEKVADQLGSRPGLSAAQALSAVPDAVRFTFCYPEDRYTRGVCSDLERMHARGFELVKPLRNSWENDQYKGINTQWRDVDSGQRFEVQFHTHTSFEAKQRTHGAYERIRNPCTSDTEREELEDMQRDVCARIHVPPGVSEIEDYPRRGIYG